MENLKVSELENGFYQFGNKGHVFNNKTHIAKSGSFSGTTLCDIPMLSSNWATILEHQEICCETCLTEYSNKK